MKVRLLTDYKVGSRVRPEGTILDVDAELGAVLIGSGEAADAGEKATKKKRNKNV